MTYSQIDRLDAGSSTMTLSLDIDLYPRDVLYAAAYVFLDRAYVLLDRDGARFIVRLRGKQPMDEATLQAMAGEFENELLAQALRQRVFKANQKVIEKITALAIGGAAGAWDVSAEATDREWASEGTDERAAMAVDDSRDFLDDPLGIAVPWEDKGDRR